MAQDEIKGNWKQMTGELKKQWGKITDDEFTQADGSRKKIVGLLQEKYGYAKDKAEEKLEKFLSDSAEEADSLKEKAAQGINDFSDNMAENFQQVKERAKEYSEGVGEYIQERPLAAILVAAGIGLALGALLLK